MNIADMIKDNTTEKKIYMTLLDERGDVYSKDGRYNFCAIHWCIIRFYNVVLKFIITRCNLNLNERCTITGLPLLLIAVKYGNEFAVELFLSR